MSRGSLVWRVLGAAVAVLVAAWLAVGLRTAVFEQRGQDELQKAVANPADKAAARRAADDLDRASSLNPDRLPRSYLAQVRVILGDRDGGRELSEQMTREEPDNQEIWRTALAISLATKDQQLQARAVRRLRELNPRGG